MQKRIPLYKWRVELNFAIFKEKRINRADLKSDMLWGIVFLIALCAYDIYKNCFSVRSLVAKIIYVVVFLVVTNVVVYIYSWKEN